MDAFLYNSLRRIDPQCYFSFATGYTWTSHSLFFFLKKKTAYELRKGDWSSDVCSSDLQSRPMNASTTSGGFGTRQPSPVVKQSGRTSGTAPPSAASSRVSPR